MIKIKEYLIVYFLLKKNWPRLKNGLRIVRNIHVENIGGENVSSDTIKPGELYWKEVKAYRY